MFVFKKERILNALPEAVDRLDVAAWNAGKIPVMVLHPKSAGHGLNLQAGRNILFFSLPWSLELFLQSIGRCHRTGQKRQVMVYHFSGFELEDRVSEALINHQNVQQYLMQNLLVPMLTN